MSTTKTNVGSINDLAVCVNALQSAIYSVGYEIESVLEEDLDNGKVDEVNKLYMDAGKGAPYTYQSGNFVSGDTKKVGLTESPLGFGRNVADGHGSTVRYVADLNTAITGVFTKFMLDIDKNFTSADTAVVGHLEFEASPIPSKQFLRDGKTVYADASVGDLSTRESATGKLSGPLLHIVSTGTMVPLIRSSTYTFNEADFSNPRTLANAIVKHLHPSYADIICAYASAAKLKSQTKSGATFGLSAAYSRSLFNNEHSEFGIYTGVEGFGEFTPKADAGGCKIHEMEVGFRPFVGVEMKEMWRIYALGGVKLRRMHIKSKLFKTTTNKPAFELGIGSDYIISDRYSIGLKVIKTLKQRQKIEGIPFESTSLKILFSVGVRF